MRFIPNGPSIPDELLTARDADQVIFFCGAGVSLAQAGLPNFVQLSESVLEVLGSAQSSPARKLFATSKKIEEETGIKSLVATDRIFGMLEREFERAEVREAVAMSLKPKDGIQLSAHQTLLDLSKTRSGKTRLVTTNFDLLFEQCEPTLDCFNPPRLPDPRRDIDFQGIIHLHGCVDENYTKARDDEFVLSSSDFGHAYLADGWATRYIQDLLERYHIVFVGYSADDPPVQYLLEALNRFKKSRYSLFAFQEGNLQTAGSQWLHKGVKPIVFDAADRYAALWNTLSAWAERARDVDGWHERFLQKTLTGPSSMTPHERGIFAHLVGTEDGSKRILRSDPCPPATWLGVVDKNLRYAGPGKKSISYYEDDVFDPFDVLRLDSDDMPSPVDHRDRYAKREVPPNAWDGFSSTSTDRTNLIQENLSCVRSKLSESVPKLTPRLNNFALWIANVAHQPTTLWWSVQQKYLHPDIQWHIEIKLRHNRDLFSPVMVKGWRLMLKVWKQSNIHPKMFIYDLDERSKKEGWSTGLVDEVIALYRPVITASKPFGVAMPLTDETSKLEEIANFDVDYPRPDLVIEIPDDFLADAVTFFRRQLELAVQLEKEVSSHDDPYFDTTRADDDDDHLDDDSPSLTSHIRTFVKLMTRLVQHDPSAARSEILRWSGMQDQVFKRLRIWAAGCINLTNENEAGHIFLELDSDTFWSSKQERDLLFAIKDRWSQLSKESRDKIEVRLIKGVIPWLDVAKNSNDDAFYRLNRLYWLHDHGVVFSFDYETLTSSLKDKCPEWNLKSTAGTAQPQISRVDVLKEDNSPGILEQLPLKDLLPNAKAVTEKYDFENHVFRRPFNGLLATQPKRAYRALSFSSKHGDFHDWAWQSFLLNEEISASSARMLSVICHRLCSLESKHLANIASSVCLWIEKHTKNLIEVCPRSYFLLWGSMISALSLASDESIFYGNHRSWIDEGFNQPSGRMATSINFLISDLDNNSQGISEDWKRCVGQLLALSGYHRLYALAMITPHLNSLFDADPLWVEANLLPLASVEKKDSFAFWSGYLYKAHNPKAELFLKLKKDLMTFAQFDNVAHDEQAKLAAILLINWEKHYAEPSLRQLISNVELRETIILAPDNLRFQTLWYLERSVLRPDSPWKSCVTTFFLRVWPRQLSVRTPAVAGRLADFSLAVIDHVPGIVSLILPFLVKTKHSGLRLSSFLGNQQELANRHSESLLDVMWATLDNDSSQWPHGSDKFLSYLSTIDATSSDPRLLELQARANNFF